LNIWLDAGSAFNARTNSLGQQSGTFDIAQVQVEPGPVDTPFERRPIGTELALCQRYYEAGNLSLFSGNVTSGSPYDSVVKYSTQKRATPSVVLTNQSATNFPLPWAACFLLQQPDSERIDWQMVPELVSLSPLGPPPPNCNPRMSILCAIPLISLLFACSEAPKVSYETIKLQRSTTIDCEGGAYNKGKVTELQILADDVTIKRCKINGSIRTIGLGHNGEAPGVKASSTTLGHTARAQAAAPKNTVLYKP
jgi:hypothetical protein